MTKFVTVHDVCDIITEHEFVYEMCDDIPISSRDTLWQLEYDQLDGFDGFITCRYDIYWRDDKVYFSFCLDIDQGYNNNNLATLQNLRRFFCNVSDDSKIIIPKILAINIRTTDNNAVDVNFKFHHIINADPKVYNYITIQ
jgi:hypothetical protein